MDEYSIINKRGAYRRLYNISFHAFESSLLSILGDPSARKAALNRTPTHLLRQSNCDMLGYDMSLASSDLSHKITLYVYLILITIGITCNMLGFRVFISKEMRNSSTHIYLMILAISDSLYLVFLFLSRALESLRCLYFPNSSFDIYNQSDIACRGLQYFIDLWSDYSACLILAFTIERFIACYHAAFFRHNCTSLNAKIVCVTIFITQAVSISPHHIMFMGRAFNVCKISKDYEKQFTILYTSEAITYRIIPVLLVTMFNICIIIKVWGMSKKRQLLRNSTRSARFSQCSATSSEVRDFEKHAQITFVLILISTCYIITYLPIFIYFILQRIITKNTVYSQGFLIYCNFSRCLYVFGHAINFFLYTTSTDMFRKELKKVLCCCVHRSEYNAVHQQTSKKSSTNV